MAITGNIVKKPISLREVAQLIGYGGNDLGTLCTHDNINMWAKFKPYPLSERLFNITDAERASNNYGIVIPEYGGEYSETCAEKIFADLEGAKWQMLKYVVKTDANGNKLTYLSDGSKQAPVRLSDFMNENQTIGYKHTTAWNVGSVTSVGTNLCFNLFVSVNGIVTEKDRPIKPSGSIRIGYNGEVVEREIVQLTDLLQGKFISKTDKTDLEVSLQVWNVGLLFGNSKKQLLGVTSLSPTGMTSGTDGVDVNFIVPADFTMPDGEVYLIPVLTYNFASNATDITEVTMKSPLGWDKEISGRNFHMAMLGNAYGKCMFENLKQTAILQNSIKVTQSGYNTTVTFDVQVGQNPQSFNFLGVIVRSFQSTQASDRMGNYTPYEEYDASFFKSSGSSWLIDRYCDTLPSTSSSAASNAAAVYNHQVYNSSNRIVTGYILNIAPMVGTLAANSKHTISITFSGKSYDQGMASYELTDAMIFADYTLNGTVVRDILESF